MEIFNTAPLSLPRLPDKARVTLLALGDVGSIHNLYFNVDFFNVEC